MPSDELTEMEREVFELMAKGLSTARMAERRCVTPATIRNQVQAILYKLDVHSRAEAVAKFHESPPTPAQRVLKLLHREGYRLTDWQKQMIAEVFPSPFIPQQPGAPIITMAHVKQL